MLGVVAIHVVGESVEDGTAPLAQDVLRAALMAAVPVFVMMSGALNLAPNALRDGSTEFLRRRARRVLPALAIWSVFYMVVIRGMVLNEDISTDMSLELIVMGKPYVHLYFLIAIAGLYIMTPVLQAFLERDEGRRAWIVGGVASAWMVLAMAPGQLVKAGILVTSPVQESAMTWPLLLTGYYVLGRAMIVRPVPRPVAWAGLALAPFFVLLMAWVFPRSTMEQTGGAPSAWALVLAPDYPSLPVLLYSVLLMAGLSSLLRDWQVGDRARRWLRPLGEATFGIFLVHYAVLVLLRRLLPALDGPSTHSALAAWTLTVVISTLIATIGRKVPGVRLVL
ncbi:acyltransferase [Brachybacterium phenoliresistens]